MKKRGIIISLAILLVSLSCFAFVAACPAGQMANFDGSCIPDPNYNAGAVSCASLMASSGKSAETLCKVNYASQCCNQATTPDTTDSSEDTASDTSDTNTPDTTDSSDANNGDSYPIMDCANEPYPTPGQCEIDNQYYALHNEIDKKLGDEYSEEEQKLLDDEYQAEQDYYINIYTPKDNELQATFDACIAAQGDNCYEAWEAPWFVNNLAESNNRLALLNKLNSDLDALPSLGNNNPPEAGITNLGTENPDYNRGRGTAGEIAPSVEGYLGDAYVMRPDGTKVIPGHELYLNVGDKAVTGKDSNLNIIFSDAGRIDLGPDTELRVGTALQDQFYLAKGTLKSKIKLAKLQKFEIDTPNAMFTIRGTEFVIDYNKTTNTTIVYLNEGVLEIKIKNKVMNLTAGNYLAIYPDGTTWTNQLKPENWEYLGNEFYDVPDVSGIVKGFMMTLLIIMIIIDLAVMVLFSFLTRKKIKNPDKKDKSTGKGIASLVLGILGILFFLAPYIGVILSTIAYYFSRVQKANKPTGLATAGFVLSLIGLILNILVLLIMFISVL